MARTLEAGQAARAASNHLHPITLVMLTTYTDRLSLTVDKRYFLADHSCFYDYIALTATETFLPVIVGGRDFFSEMVHLPDPSDTGPYDQRIEIGISNLVINGTRFVKTLQAHALEGATVEVSQLLVDEITAGVMDLSAMTGQPHTVLFRGRVNSVAPITETEFTLNCAMDLPSMGGESNPSDIQAWSMDAVSPWVAVGGTSVALKTSSPSPAEGTGYLNLSSDNSTIENAMEAASVALDFRGKIMKLRVQAPASFHANMGNEYAFHLKVSSETGVSPIADDYNTYIISTALIPLADTWYEIYIDFARIPDDSAGTCDLTALRVFQLAFNQGAAAAEDAYFDEVRVISRDPSWLYSTDPTVTDPRDVGARWPMVYGQAKRVRCINHQVGWQTTLVRPISDDDTVAIEFTDLTGLPASPTEATIQIGLEEMTAVKVDKFTATLSDRGKNGTRASAHKAGEITIEILNEAIFGVAGHGCESIQAVYIVNPATGELVRMPNLIANANPFDSQFSPGRSVALIKVSGEELSETLKELFADVDIEEAGTTFINAFSDVNAGQTQGSPKLYQLTGATGTTPLFSGSGSPFQSDWVKAHWSDASLADTVVVKWRLVIKGNADQTGDDGNGGTFLVMQSKNIPGMADTHFARITFPQGVVSTGLIARGSWKTPPGGTLVSDLETCVGDSYLRIWSEDSIGIFALDAGTTVTAVMAGIGLEIETTATPAIPTFLGSMVGFGLEVYADVNGYIAPDALYDAAQGALIEHPADVIKHHIETYGEAVDTTSNTALVTSLDAAAKFAGDIRPLGDDWAPILQRLAFEARTNVIADQESTGREWKSLAAGTNYGWGTATPSITEWQSFTDNGRAIEDLASSFLFHYEYDPTLAFAPTQQEDLFANTLVANKDVSDVDQVIATDIETEAKNFGAIAADPYTFLMIQDDATATEMAGYLVQERMASARRVFEMTGVPWYEALPLVLGDLVNVTPPWDTSSKLCRIISMRRKFFDHSWDIVAVEVTAT